MSVMPVAFFVSNDEDCFNLAEVNLPAADSKSVRRYQLIYVMRDQRVAECRVDLGPRESFTAAPFQVPGGVYDEATGKFEILHTVGELRDIADFQRHGYIPMPHVEPSDLAGQWRDLIDRRRKARTNQSLFGPHGHHQRGN